MVLFLSTSVNKIDKKGRVSVPAAFRAALAKETFEGVVVMRAQNHACLEGFAFSSMEEIARRLDDFDLFSATQDDLATSVFGEAHQLSFDKEGRIILPEELMAYANIIEQVAFVGMGGKFQLWEPGAYDARREQARASVQKNKLTIPNKGGAA